MFSAHTLHRTEEALSLVVLIYSRHVLKLDFKEFFEAHRDVLLLRSAAKEAFKKVDGKLPSVKALDEEFQELLQEKKATARVLPTPDVWHGVTYKEDKPQVMAAIKELKESGLYPDVLWA